MKSLLLIMFIFINYAILTFAQAPDTLCTKLYGGSANDKGASVLQMSNGGFIITGFTFSFGAGNNDVWLIKTDSFGDTIWTRTFGDSSHEWGGSVQQTLDGGFIIGGMTNSKGSSRYDFGAWLIKTREGAFQ